ncbi:carboxypeptidase-like regulatory domain-containing protein [Flavobacteriaceae bacterium F08102]|nr:carboxypeptidase-like regulatory domain-containing protein [Flavobacteriaceae bacterium F08102]
MKKLIFTLLCMVVVGTSFAQLKLEGVVKDTVGEPLELANVVAINQETKALDSYGITNDKGRYKLNLKPNTNYKIQVSYIGFTTADVIINTKDVDIDRDFILKEDVSLDEIELTYEMPIIIKGDTMIYNADSFKSGTERKLEDILKKLPGVEINDLGQIEVEGKAVSKLMVNGKNFFDGDTKLGTQNIPSNAVDKIEVLKNFTEVGQLRSVQNNQDNVAINIKLKQGKDKFWFGNVTAGGGVAQEDPLYLIQPKLFYYSPKTSLNFIGDLNNMGEVAFTRRDYFNFGSGFRAPSQSSGTSINLGSNSLGFSQSQSDRVDNINSKLAAMNFNHSPKEGLDLSGFGIYSGNRTDMRENRSIQYTDASLNLPDEDTESKTHQASDLAMVKFKTKYVPNTSNQLDYQIVGRVSTEQQDQNVFSSVSGNVGELEGSEPYSINQNLNYYYTLDDRNIFAFSGQHLLQDEDPFYNAIFSDPTFDETAEDIGFDTAQNTYNINQEKRIKSNQLDAKLDYWNILSPKSNINLTLGLVYSNQKFDSDIFQFLDNGSRFDPVSTIINQANGNEVDYTFSDSYLGFEYRFKSGIFTVSPGFSAHAYGTKSDQLTGNYKDNFFRVLPKFNARIDLKKSESITVNYVMSTQFTDVTKIAQGLMLNRYNSYSVGLPDLESSLRHNVSLNYRSFNMFNYTNMNGSLSYSKNINQIRNSAQFAPGSVVRISAPFNSDFSDESASANGRFQRAFGKLRASLGGNLSYNKFNQIINNNTSFNENYTYGYNIGVNTNFLTAPNFDLSYRYSIQDSDQGNRRTKFYTHSPRINFDALIFKAFTFRSNFSYNLTKNETETLNIYRSLDASLAYRKDQDSKWELELKGSNLLNAGTESNTSIGTYFVSFTENFIQPRFVTLRVRYTI